MAYYRRHRVVFFRSHARALIERIFGSVPSWRTIAGTVLYSFARTHPEYYCVLPTPALCVKEFSLDVRMDLKRVECHRKRVATCVRVQPAHFRMLSRFLSPSSSLSCLTSSRAVRTRDPGS